MPNNKDTYQEVTREFQRHIEDTETSKLAHFYAAEQYEKRHRILLGIPATSFAILLTWLLTSPLETLFSPTTALFLKNSFSVLLSLLVAILSALSALLNYNDLAIRHRTAAQKYHALWRKCINWRTDFPSESEAFDATKTAKLYRERLNEINHDSPQIPKWAWKSVSAQQKEGSTSYNFENLPDGG